MTPTCVLLGLLSFAPPEGASAAPPAPSVQAPADASEAEYQQALERVRTAQGMANENPERGAVQLRDALQLLSAFGPTLAKDPNGQDLRTMALMMLSRALLATEDADGAREVMDNAIRTSRGDPLPTKQFGPGLAALYKERAGVLSKLGEGSIIVNCRVPCSVYLNERPTRPQTDRLVPGRYRVWVTANSSDDADLQRSVEVEANVETKIDFGAAPIPIEPPPPIKTKRDRLMPRWAEIVLMSAGAAAIGTGAALWTIDGRCPAGADPNDVEACPQVYITKTAGIVTLGLGAAALLGGTLTLTVDEVKAAQRRGTEVALHWRLRF